jgi:hypothetical protein
MKLKTLSFLFLIFTLVSCGKSGSNGSGGDSGDFISLDEISTQAPVPQGALNFDVALNFQGFTRTQQDKILTAAELIKKVVASEEFKNKVLNHKFKGKKTFVDNGGLTNAQIYKKIVEGSEKLRPGVDNTMNLDLVQYRASNNVVGYTYPSTIEVWMNAMFLNRNSPAKVTTNMMHEWLHKLGFTHSFKPTSSRQYSVPYAVGYLVARLAKKHS